MTQRTSLRLADTSPYEGRGRKLKVDAQLVTRENDQVFRTQSAKGTLELLFDF